MDFQDKVVVITGASKGIGRATALAFSARGARVVLVSRHRDAGEAVLEEIRGTGGEGIFVPVDVAVPEQVQGLVARADAEWGRIDILINNAGIYMQGDVGATSVTDWERLMAVNVTGAFLCTKYAVPVMARTGGVIVNVSSEAGLVGIPHQVAYNVSKAALIGLTRSCAVDLASMGIRVNCVCPGTTETPLVRDALQRTSDPEAARRRLEADRPLNRLGRPEEIAAAILFLADEEVGYATGAVLSIDGGYTVQ